MFPECRSLKQRMKSIYGPQATILASLEDKEAKLKASDQYVVDLGHQVEAKDKEIVGRNIHNQVAAVYISNTHARIEAR